MLAWNWSHSFGWPEIKGEMYVYVAVDMNDKSRFKIGISALPLRRSTQFKEPHHIVFAASFPRFMAVSIERQLHAKYANKKITGEWFSLSFEDLGRIGFGLCVSEDGNLMEVENG